MHERPGVCKRCLQAAFEPFRVGDAVVVGEGDQGRPCDPPSFLAADGGTARRLTMDSSQHETAAGGRLIEEGLRAVRRPVIDHDHLEPLGRERLTGERPEELREVGGAVSGRDDDRDGGRGGVGHGAKR